MTEWATMRRGSQGRKHSNIQQPHGVPYLVLFAIYVPKRITNLSSSLSSKCSKSEPRKGVPYVPCQDLEYDTMHPDHPIARKRWDWVAKLWCQDFVDCMSNHAQALLSWWPRNWHRNWDTLRQFGIPSSHDSTSFNMIHSESSRDHVLYHRGKRKGYGSVLAICGSTKKRSGFSYNFSMELVPQIESKWMASQGWNLLHLIKITSRICAKSSLHLSANPEGTKLKSHRQRKGEQDIRDILVMRRVLRTQHTSSFDYMNYCKDHTTI